MPLTNPNKIVTEERLSEFYGQILPYMGGMPDVLANKFSKGDLYSTDEKMIGCWVDNRPLYQKTVVSTLTKSGSLYRSDISVSNLNIDDVINIFGTVKLTDSSNIVHLPNGADFSGSASNALSMYIYNNTLTTMTAHTSANGGNAKVTIQYTKTTDSPISIGSDTDYSTDEKIVGTWIDGSSVWQKTIATGGNVPSGATLILRTAMASTGYDTILYTKTS